MKVVILFSMCLLLQFLNLGKTSEEEISAQLLFQTLKDHKMDPPIRLLAMDKIRVIKESARNEGYDIDNVQLANPIKPIHVVLTRRLDTEVRTKIKENLKAVPFGQLCYLLKDECGNGKIIINLLTN